MIKDINFKTYDGIDRRIQLRYDETLSEKYPLAVFFFGGGWMSGNIGQFVPQADELSKLGYMCALVEYRVHTKENATIDVSLKDAFYALKHLSDNSDELLIDTNNVFYIGGSAGGHLAICSVLLNNVKNNFNVKGVAMFNGVIDTTETGYSSTASQIQDFNPIVYSPYHHLKENLPPVLMMIGSGDTTIPYQRGLDFIEKYKNLGNKAHLVVYDGRTHGFFNIMPKNKYEDYIDTLNNLIDFIGKYCD